MDRALIPLVLLLIGLAMGMLLAGCRYMLEISRMVRFLRGRDPAGNARATAGTAPGMTALAEAVNAELDRAADAHIEALRRQQAFRRELSALSHDIRTPLTAAKGYLELAADESDPADRDRFLSAAARRIDATTELLDGLFAYARSRDPDLALKPEPIALKRFTEEVLLAQYPAFEERGWEPVLAFEEPGVVVRADRAALERVVTNLVTNALRHGAGAPRISERCLDGRIELSVTNAVRNPAAMDVERLFERFYQGDAARGSQGSGLGLSVAANLSRAMGVKPVAALSVDGELTVTLDLERAAPASIPPASVPASR